jgi:hypothetical protein
MDRGIKIAILAACLLSLGFGLVWDKVIDGARRIIKDDASADSLGPVGATLRVGDTSLPAPEGQGAQATPSPAAAQSSATPNASKSTPDTNPGYTNAGIPITADTPAHIKAWVEKGIIKDGKYLVQKGDSPRAIALTSAAFKYLGKNEFDWHAANPQYKSMDEFAKRLIAGHWLTIPQ